MDLHVLLGCAAVLVAAAARRAVKAATAAANAFRAWRDDLTGVVRRRLLDEYRRVADAQDPRC